MSQHPQILEGSHGSWLPAFSFGLVFACIPNFCFLFRDNNLLNIVYRQGVIVIIPIIYFYLTPMSVQSWEKNHLNMQNHSNLKAAQKKFGNFFSALQLPLKLWDVTPPS